MTSQALQLRNLSSWTMFIFGLMATILGVIGLISPESTLSLLNFPILDREARAVGDFSLTFLTASSMASFNIGIYYMLAALNNLRMFYLWTVPFRVVTFSVFLLAIAMGTAPAGFIGVALWELIGALATGGALWWEARRPTA